MCSFTTKGYAFLQFRGHLYRLRIFNFILLNLNVCVTEFECLCFHCFTTMSWSGNEHSIIPFSQAVPHLFLIVLVLRLINSRTQATLSAIRFGDLQPLKVGREG